MRSEKDAILIKNLSNRIHNQRVQLRINWMIVDQRWMLSQKANTFLRLYRMFNAEDLRMKAEIKKLERKLAESLAALAICKKALKQNDDWHKLHAKAEGLGDLYAELPGNGLERINKEALELNPSPKILEDYVNSKFQVKAWLNLGYHNNDGYWIAYDSKPALKEYTPLYIKKE